MDNSGRTPLLKAAGRGHLDVVERLLEEKAEVNARYHSGRKALQAAAEGGHLDVVERLLQEKAEVNTAAGVDGITALQACHMIVLLLIPVYIYTHLRRPLSLALHTLYNPFQIPSQSSSSRRPPCCREMPL